MRLPIDGFPSLVYILPSSRNQTDNMQTYTIDTLNGYVEISAESEDDARRIADAQARIADLIAESRSWESASIAGGVADLEQAEARLEDAARIYFDLWDFLGCQPPFDLCD